jgi:hypothetical protein
MDYSSAPTICLTTFNVFERTTGGCLNATDMLAAVVLVTMVYGINSMAIDLYRCCKRQ